MRTIGALISILGLVLMSAVLIGHFGIYTGIAPAMPAPKERFRAELVTEARTLSDLDRFARRSAKRSFDGLPARQKMEHLFAAVIDRFTHGELRHTIFTNWIMSAGGLINGNVSFMRVPDGVLKYGQGALCSEVSYILLRLAANAGIPARHVGLNGHVVMEAWYDNGWHMYDPDFEIVARTRQGVASVEELSRNESLLKQYYGHIPNVETAFRLRSDHNYAAYPQGSQFVWKAQFLMIVETIAEVMKFVIPGLLIVAGISLLFYRPRKFLS
jgi:hypothetical protein